MLYKIIIDLFLIIKNLLIYIKIIKNNFKEEDIYTDRYYWFEKKPSAYKSINSSSIKNL